MSLPDADGNELACYECEDPIPDGDLKYSERYGTWDRDAQNVERGSSERHYCSDCWQEEFGREAAAYHEVDDPNRLWRILEASDGQLVADTLHMTLGGRGWFTVIDGDVVAFHTTTSAREEDGERILEFGTEQSDVDEEDFYDLFDVPDREDGMPMYALIRPRSETPLQDYVHVDEEQQRLGDERGEA